MSEHILFSNSKFEILKKVAEKEQSPTDLSQKLGFSVPYVHQQMVLLEAQGFIKKKVLKDGSNGKPKQIYRLINEFANISLVREGFAEQFKISKEGYTLLYLQLISMMPSSNYFLFSKYYWQNVEEIFKLKSLSLISYDDEKIELFGVADANDVFELRKKISHVKLKDVKNEDKIIVCWVNTVTECQEGILKKDNYYLSHITRAKVLFDNENILKELKEEI
ncbi:MAG: hypothetical protein AB7V77_02540 [Candidatus Woesearchaeota archaeon]